MKREEWIKTHTTGKFENADKQVIEFIANFIYANEQISDGVYDLFASGYCYYFAVMLKEAFNRGDICWHRNHGHIVWRDNDGIAYDIGGVFYDYEEDDLLPVRDSLRTMIYDFKHNGESFRAYDPKFRDWAKHYKMTDTYAVSDIYRNMPREEIDDDFTVEYNAMEYWIRNKQELSEYYAKKKHEANIKKNER